MKKLILFTAMLIALPFSSNAQDDMYFVPGKKNKQESKSRYESVYNTYHSGSDRDVDEYNRRGLHSSYQPILSDSAMQDVIDFTGEEGVYPDSTTDYRLTREMSRWDGYEPTQAYWDGYNDGRNDGWSLSWHSPWYYSSFYPWYDSWYYDPWYRTSWHWGWYDPWYYPYYGWGGYYSSWYYRPYYYGGGRHYSSHTYARNGNRGTLSRYGSSHGSFSGQRATNTTGVNSRSNRAAGGRAATGVQSSTNRQSTYTSQSGNFSGTRSSSATSSSSRTSTYTPSRSSSSSSGSFGGGSRSGGFSGGSIGGGSRSGGSIGGSSRGGGRR